MSEDVRRLVGRNVRRLRIVAGLSQAELAERMGVDRAYVSGLELGQRNPTIVNAAALANEFALVRDACRRFDLLSFRT
jgi:transcriptional regulator with XRE-family HTH domain